LYVGGGFGYGMYNLDTQWLAAGLPFTFPLTQTQGGRGWLGTVTAGADYQFNDKIVAGVFGDYDFASIKGTLQNQGPFSIGTTKETSAWAVGARVGWLFNPAILTYFNGGYAQAHFSQADMVLGEISDPASGSVVSSIPSHTYRGWFLGAGIEAGRGAPNTVMQITAVLRFLMSALTRPLAQDRPSSASLSVRP
jgi:outer membrane immunogenic protein